MTVETDPTLALLERLLAIMEAGGTGEPQEIFTACSNAINTILRLDITIWDLSHPETAQ